MRSTPLRFRVECLWNILFKKCGISNQPVAASAMIRVFPSLDHSSGACPPIVSGVSDMRPPGVQTWKRRGIRCSHPAGRNTHIFLQRMFQMQFHPKSVSGTFYILLIAKGAGHGKRQLHKIQLVYMTIQVVRWKRYR